jgi:branched-chain amino acid transport system ATP-binding protein
MLVVNNIEVRYQTVILVLKGCSLQVDSGTIVALIGGNGGGKTTMLKAISGLLVSEEGEVTDGTIEFDGVRIDTRSPEKRVEMGITQIMEGRRVFEHLSVEENLVVGGHKHSKTLEKKSMERVFEYFPILKNIRSRIAGYLSGGEQQMLVIGRSLMSQPKLMLLDEPSLGLAPLIVDEIFNIVQRINAEEKTSALLVEQNAMAALDIAVNGYVMENGKIVLDGPADKLRNNEDVKEFYMGLSEVGKKKSYKEVKHYKRRKRWLA